MSKRDTYSYREPERQRSHYIDVLGGESVDLKSRISAFFGDTKITIADGVLNNVALTFAYLRSSLGQFESHLEKLGEHRHKRGNFARMMMHDLGVDTPPKRIDWFSFILIVQIGFFFETGIVAFSLVSDGTLDWPSALGTAAIFALVNIALGFFAGFGGLRLALHKSKVTETSALDRRTRRIGWFGYWSLIATLVFMIFMAARVRVTGHHDAVFNFQSVSFLATFNDSMAWLIIVIATLSSAIAIWKGYMIDPYRGLSAAISHATKAIESEAEKSAHSNLYAMDARVGSVLADAYGSLEEAEDIIDGSSEELRALNSDIEYFNHEIDGAIAHLRDMHAAQIKRYEATSDSTLEDIPEFDVSALRALKLKPLPETAVVDASPHHIDLQALRAEADKLDALHQSTADQTLSALSTFKIDQPILSPVTKPQGV